MVKDEDKEYRKQMIIVKIMILLPSYISYLQLWARGRQIYQKTMTFDTGNTNFDVPIFINTKTARDLAPNARILVWYITDIGEIIADSVDFSVVARAENQVDLK